MRKYIRILEVPLLLLILAIDTYANGYLIITMFLLLVSVVRLFVNVATDEFVYKR